MTAMLSEKSYCGQAPIVKRFAGLSKDPHDRHFRGMIRDASNARFRRGFPELPAFIFQATPPTAMSETHSLQADGLGFLQAAESALHIRQHMDLFLWLQGDFHKYLPHDVLIAAWGDFPGGQISFDVISPLPRIRTERLYTLGMSNPAAIPACRERPQSANRSCGANPFLLEMHRRWLAVGRMPCATLRKDGDGTIDFICADCDDSVAGLLNSMRSSLVHGFSDQRGKLECIYVFLSTEELSDPGYRRALRFLLPYLDYSLRQISHLPMQLGESAAPAIESDETADSIGLSQREAEIMEWVRIGKTNYEVGMILDISAFTVKNHLQRIFKKLDATNRAQAVEKLNRLNRRG